MEGSVLAYLGIGSIWPIPSFLLCMIILSSANMFGYEFVVWHPSLSVGHYVAYKLHNFLHALVSFKFVAFIVCEKMHCHVAFSHGGIEINASGFPQFLRKLCAGDSLSVPCGIDITF